MWYNVRIKTFPDGHKQYLWSENYILRDIPDEYKIKRKKKLPIPGQALKGRFKNNMNRSIQKVYDLARCNEFRWFITLTFDPNKVNRYDYDSCVDAIKRFTDRLRKNGNKWLIVPEQHKDGAYHFHGLVTGELPLKDSGRRCYNEKSGQEYKIYNLANYDYGFTTATEIVDSSRTASYIAKYLTKDITVPKGRKCYWASKSLARPQLDYVRMEHNDFWFGVYAPARYVKDINGSFGRFALAEE